MKFVRRELFTAALVLGLSGCIFASMRPDTASTASLTSARVQASMAAPCLPILALRTARDDIGLLDVDRANVSMIVDVAELDARTLDRSRAALLEGLARGVDAGKLDDTLIAILTDQMEWAAAEVAPRMQKALVDLHETLTPSQRLALAAELEGKLPNWSQTWAAQGRHAWLDAWPSRAPEVSDVMGDMSRTSRSWGEKSVANVRAALPHLDAAQRRALAASLRTGHAE